MFSFSIRIKYQDYQDNNNSEKSDFKIFKKKNSRKIKLNIYDVTEQHVVGSFKFRFTENIRSF